jgi:hypothetical protein
MEVGCRHHTPIALPPEKNRKLCNRIKKLYEYITHINPEGEKETYEHRESESTISFKILSMQRRACWVQFSSWKKTYIHTHTHTRIYSKGRSNTHPNQLIGK